MLGAVLPELLKHLDGILNYCRTKVPMGVVEAVNGNIKTLLRRGRGYKNLRYLLLKAQRMARSRSTISATSASKDVSGAHPSRCRAFAAHPTNGTLSVGR